jgi:twitching motility protein PilT
MAINEIFSAAIKAGASDVHLAAGYPATFRVSDELTPYGKALSDREVAALARELLDDRRWKEFQTLREFDFAHEAGAYRFRVNLHFERDRVALAARLIPLKIPSMDDLLLPETIREFAQMQNGLVLFTGPAGCGKSTALAAILENINETQERHIVTLEDPIEYVFPRAQGLVKQREVGTDTLSFAEGLRRCLRQDPDVIMVGEMRDPETIATALTIAETGHLVFSTLHTNDAAQAAYRIVDSFTGAQQEQVRRQLALSLRAVVAQMLLPMKGGGLVAAREILVNTPAVANLIRENKVEQMPTAIQTGRAAGMISMEQAIRDLRDGELIDEDTASRLLPSGSRSLRRR